MYSSIHTTLSPREPPPPRYPNAVVSGCMSAWLMSTHDKGAHIRTNSRNSRNNHDNSNHNDDDNDSRNKNIVSRCIAECQGCGSVSLAAAVPPKYGCPRLPKQTT